MIESVSGIHWLTRRLGDVPSHNDWLTPVERKVLAGLGIVKRRADWRLGRWTVKCALLGRRGGALCIRRHRDVEVLAGADGAPVVFHHQRPLPVTISISHSGGVGFCVFAERDVGCDAELVEPRSHAFIRDYFRPEERRAVFLAPAAYRPLLATLTWSAKESVLKVLHAGLRRDTRTVAVDVPRVRGGRGPAWSRFSARCTDGPERFDGWWRTSGRHLLTVTVRAPQGVEL